MECVEAVYLKASIRKEMALKQTQLQPPFVEDSLVANASNVTSYDDFSIDELLDFSNEDAFMLQEGGEDFSGFPSSSPKQEPTTTTTTKSQNSCALSTKDDFTPVVASELDVPVEELESLEWLSHFVEDSNSEYSTPFPAGTFLPKPVTVSEPEKLVQTDCCFKTPVPAKARSKRPRTGAKTWSLGSPSLTESSSSSTTTTSSSSSSSLILDSVEPVEKPPLKKQKKKPATGEGLHGAAAPRRCSHCGVQKTPQWRAGPLGAKTLCNACGVRYKSGRLFPEYRPACSPTFSSELHSNHHRKVLEMRKKKEVILGQVDPGVAAPPVVPSFDRRVG